MALSLTEARERKRIRAKGRDFVQAMIRYSSFTFIFYLVTACSVTGVGSSSTLSTASAMVTGTVTYRERIALPPDAVLEVQLFDLSLVDTAAILIAEQTVIVQHQVPLAFELSYDPADIDERMSYAVRAAIRIAGKAMFITNRSYPVLTRGNPNHVDLILIRHSG